jgi:predicted Zn-dependent peptidase
MVADILRNSVFDPDELQRERGVILQEIGQALDTPDDLVFDQFQLTAFPGQPLGRPVLGTAETVEAIGRDDLFAFLARHYTASNMVLSAAGRVENTHLVLGCQGIGYRDPDYFALAIYSTLFGGGMSSRLFQRIREERGLVYGIHCFNTAYADGGLFGIYAGTGEDDLAELVPAVCEEFAGVADTLSEAELVRARNQIKAGTLMALESSGARSEQAARHLIIHGRPIPYAEIVTRIEAVDQAAVQRVARRLLQGELTLAALGPIDELEPLDKIAARLAA